MHSNSRLLFLSSVLSSVPLALFFASGVAHAQDSASAAGQDQPTSDVTPQTTTQTADSTQTANSTSYVPPPEQPALTQEPTTPKPKPCTWSNGPCVYPHLVLSLDGGVSHFAEGTPVGFDSGTGSITSLGAAWGLRFGAELLPWLAVEAHYIGLSNRADASVSSDGGRTLITTAGTAEVRFTAPTPFVQPYLVLGAGVYSTTVSGKSSTTQLHGSTEFGVPVGVGFGIPIDRGISVGAEATYHRFFGESFAEDDEIGGGDPVSANAVVRVRF